jgi:hypothetical protein
MGTFICTLSERDWPISQKRGIYGNRYFKEGTRNALGDVQQLSIVRDLITVSKGDTIFFHIRGRQTIHGIYRARTKAFFDDSIVWNDPQERFPYRFLYEPHPDFEMMCRHDANTEVRSLYEIIDRREFVSLVTLEFEQNIEARSVKRILSKDAENIVRLLHRDFRQTRETSLMDFDPVSEPKGLVPLRKKITKVGTLENAIKAIFLSELQSRSKMVTQVLSIPDEFDFANEFVIAPTTRKAVDVFVAAPDYYSVIEFKTERCDAAPISQALYYRDLLRQSSWVTEKATIVVAIVAQRFNKEANSIASQVNKLDEPIKLLKYVPDETESWADFEDVTPD